MKKSKYAIVSLTLGALSFIQIFGIEKALAAGIFGILALNELKKDAAKTGRGAAMSGIILGAAYIITVGLLFFFKSHEIVGFFKGLK
ncbi:MAG: hypothetical protein CVU77_08235 [Elusimicrobia bacterium HGW-Elusimicrobia-1]|jgi:hypothetical protein|nr:MAG: hypothetical protein CVU77_08235 [Elusimicrobia bacterium HGW-Elusimicrobia-1]